MSKYLPEKRFSFISMSRSVDSESFGVVQFTGTEGISIPYEFDIMLVSDNATIDLDDMLASPVKFTIHRKNGTDVDFHGMLDSFEQLHKYDNYIFYRAHLVPRLWWLSITHHNQVCLSRTVPEIIELALKDSGLHKSDFEFKLRTSYKPIGYVCQYNESHFNFVSRWLEREGIYYFFDQQGPSEKIVFADTNIAHTTLQDVNYIPPDGLAGKENAEVLTAFICRQKQLPQKIMLKDYNYERPSLDVKGFADVDNRGKGVDYIYGESFQDSEEGNRLASIRAEIHNSRKREFIGESSVPFLSPGYIFTLKGHYRSDFNQQYLVTGITHEGNQVGYLLPGITQGLIGYENNIYYRNSFTSIPANVQYRSELKAQKSRISGTLNATIDAEGSGHYAELDNYGRYKVRLPFDESSEHRCGKASTYLRMLQPYANQKGGMQFPLTKGTEVLLTFIDGDPDRPVIAGAIANPETPSPVTDKNQTEAVIQTGGNNKIRLEDKKGKERIIMESPTSNSWVRIGAPNDPPDVFYANIGQDISTIKDGDNTWVCQSTAASSANEDLSGTVYAYKLDKQCTVLRNHTEGKTIIFVDDIRTVEIPGENVNNLPPTMNINNQIWYSPSSVNWVNDFAQVTFYRLKNIRVIVQNDNRVSDDGDGIKIKTSGVLVEESSGDQKVLLSDNRANIRYQLSIDSINNIKTAIDEANNNIDANVTSLNALKTRPSSIIQPTTNAKFDAEITRLNSLKITVAEKNRVGDLGIEFENQQKFFEKVDEVFPLTGDKKSTAYLKNKIIRSAILRFAINKNARSRDESIAGSRSSFTTGIQKIIALSDNENPCRVEMTHEGIIIDAGTERDITIQCRNLLLNNENEDNITYGDDNAEHYGTATEKFYGTARSDFYGYSEDHFRGDKLETHHGSSGSWYMGHKIEGMLGPSEAFSLAQSFEMYAGAKEELSLAEAFELFVGLKQEISMLHAFELSIGSSTEIRIGPKTEISNIEAKEKKLEIKWEKIKIGKHELKISKPTFHIIP